MSDTLRIKICGPTASGKSSIAELIRNALEDANMTYEFQEDDSRTIVDLNERLDALQDKVDRGELTIRVEQLTVRRPLEEHVHQITDPNQPKEHVAYFRDMHGGGDLWVTLASVQVGEYVGVGMSIRNPLDQPSRPIGRKVALGRAYKAVEKLRESGKSRTKFKDDAWAYRTGTMDVRDVVRRLRAFERDEFGNNEWDGERLVSLARSLLNRTAWYVIAGTREEFEQWKTTYLSDKVMVSAEYVETLDQLRAADPDNSYFLRVGSYQQRPDWPEIRPFLRERQGVFWTL